MGGAVSWEELAGRSLARQFPVDAPDGTSLDAAGVADAVRRTGPVQSQTARSPFLGLAARFPGVTRAALTAAYDEHAIVRGSSLRGTVHTCTPEQHPLLEVATRLGQGATWRRHLRLEQPEVERLWASLETYAADEWRTPAELLAHVQAQVDTDLQTGLGRYLGFGHGGLVRRPLKGGWEGQGAPGYRTAAALLGDQETRSAALADPEAALVDLVRVHLACHGPASRQDLAWWAGLTLGAVDRALESLGLDTVTGPDGRAYADLPGVPEPRELPGVRFLPEFDALMCAYQPAARARFMTGEHSARLWNLNNGMVMPPLLVDGRITGYWRAGGTARKRPLEVVWFAGTRKPRKAELVPPIAALEAVLGISVTGVTLTREAV